ncbi:MULTISPECIES: GntR family transcriptional regulator [Intrasporangiaceae]|uniref:Regulator n=1 Tax=Intrasporangium chromatireducens Q5-1 TaxID=584657 RepID=W9GHM7_9MICO|nr:GntR family transcriptional regulator [Intrasporangium chromatireducens]EWT04672.1 regulator [Intrasporangium chromatireducens Q5-1]
MTLVLTLQPDDPTPPYQQVRRQLADLITAGLLGPGDRLPPLRQLAGDLGVAVGTVGRAYRELEQEGLLTSRRGGGTRVAAHARAPEGGRRQLLEGMAAEFVARARTLGFTDEEIIVALGRQLPS